MDRYIKNEDAEREIGRFVGYLDEDMIARLKIALRKLPAKDAEEIAREYAEAHQEDLKRQVGVALVGLVRCPKCGKVVPDTDFCGKCGADMRETEVLK